MGRKREYWITLNEVWARLWRGHTVLDLTGGAEETGKEELVNAIVG